MSLYRVLLLVVVGSLCRTRVLELLKKWIEGFAQDFKSGCAARELLDTWLAKQFPASELTLTGSMETTLADDWHEKQGQLAKKIQALLSSSDLIQKNTVPIAPTPPPVKMAHEHDPEKTGIPLPPPPPPADDMSRFCVLDFPPSKVAQQLTYIDFQMFSAVRFSEFYHTAWMKKNCEVDAPNLVRLIRRFDQMSQWIQTSIVRVRDLKKRAAVLSRFIHIAQEFEWLHNFQGMMMVNAALNNSAIARLKHTWACLSEADQQKFDSIQTFFSPYHNYQAYRQKLRNGIPPIIPLMVLLLQDLTFIDENEDKVTRKKYRSEAEASTTEGASKEEEGSPAEPPTETNAAEATSAATGQGDDDEELVNFLKMDLIA